MLKLIHYSANAMDRSWIQAVFEIKQTTYIPGGENSVDKEEITRDIQFSKVPLLSAADDDIDISEDIGNMFGISHTAHEAGSSNSSFFMCISINYWQEYKWNIADILINQPRLAAPIKLSSDISTKKIRKKNALIKISSDKKN